MIVIIRRVTTLGAETTRDRLVAAAIDVFVAQGYEGARVQDIARAAGLTTGAIYANYRAKRDLLFDAIGHRAGAEVDALLEQAAGPDARDLLERLGGMLLHRRPQKPPLLLDAVVAARRDPDLAAVLRARVAAREQQLGGLVERAKATGTVDAAVDTDVLARFCVTVALGALVVRALELDPPDQVEWQALVHRLLDVLAPTEEAR
jgi:AcrR family transcriptional regulator